MKQFFSKFPNEKDKWTVYAPVLLKFAIFTANSKLWVILRNNGHVQSGFGAIHPNHVQQTLLGKINFIAYAIRAMLISYATNKPGQVWSCNAHGFYSMRNAKKFFKSMNVKSSTYRMHTFIYLNLCKC